MCEFRRNTVEDGLLSRSCCMCARLVFSSLVCWLVLLLLLLLLEKTTQNI
jgi:hypothetical protein